LMDRPFTEYAVPPRMTAEFKVPDGTITLSVSVGTPVGLQFPAVFQSADAAPVQVLGGAAPPVSPKVADNVPAAALKLWAPVPAPSVTAVPARPRESVTTVAVSTEPPPATTEKVTATPGTPSRSLPLTCTTRGWAK